MRRRRYAVALLIPEPARHGIDALRHALGDTQRFRIPTHITLVAPLNIRDDELDGALAVVRDAGARSRPLRLELGPAETFLPDAPVLYLAVGDQGAVRALRTLRALLMVVPFERPDERPYVPHVTLLTHGSPEKIHAAVQALCDARFGAVVEYLTVLECHEDSVWRPAAEVPLGAPVVVGRGSVDVELAISTVVDPEAKRLMIQVRDEVAGEQGEWPHDDREAVVITARHDGVVVGALAGWIGMGRGRVDEVAVAKDVRRHGIGSRLLAAFESAANDRRCPKLTMRVPAASTAQVWCENRGWHVAPGKSDMAAQATLTDSLVEMLRG